MRSLIERILREAGPRPPCSPAERNAVHLLASEWQGVCDRARVEPFTCKPHTFLGVIPVSAGLYLLSAGLYWVFPVVSALFMGAAVLALYYKLVRYQEAGDGVSGHGRAQTPWESSSPGVIPTRGIFLDGIYDEKYLTFTSRELFTGARHDAKL